MEQLHIELQTPSSNTHFFLQMKLPKKITPLYPCWIAWKVGIIYYTRSLSVIPTGTARLSGASCCAVDPTSCRGVGHGRYMAHDASAFGSHHGWMEGSPKRGWRMDLDWNRELTGNQTDFFYSRWLADMACHESKHAIGGLEVDLTEGILIFKNKMIQVCWYNVIYVMHVYNCIYIYIIYHIVYIYIFVPKTRCFTSCFPNSCLLIYEHLKKQHVVP